MTEIKLYKKDDSIQKFSVCGHSGYGAEGTDIVCAAVSSVLWTTINGLETVLCIDVNTLQNGADVTCELPRLTKSMQEKADILTKAMELFFLDLAKQYDRYLSVMEV